MSPIVVIVGQARAGKDTAAEVLCRRYQGAAVAFADPIKRFLLLCGLTEAQLWGDQKEVEFGWESEGASPGRVDFAAALSEAVAEWKDVDEIYENISFEAWLQRVPLVTTPRHMMQTFGTECVRAWDPNFWVDCGLHVADLLLDGRYGAYYERTKGVLVTGESGVKPANGANTPVNLVCFPDGRFRNEPLRVKRRGGLALRLVRPDADRGLSDQAKRHASETEQGTMPDWWFDGVICNDTTLGALQDRVELWGRQHLGPATNP